MHQTIGNARDPFGFLWGPLRDFGTDFIHTVNTLADELLVLPTILEDVPENTPNQSHVRTWTETDELICVRCSTREAWIADDQGGVILLLGLQNVLQRDRVRLGRITADEEDRT